MFGKIIESYPQKQSLMNKLSTSKYTSLVSTFFLIFLFP